jgi:hypothetical protein
MLILSSRQKAVRFFVKKDNDEVAFTGGCVSSGCARSDEDN